MRTALLRVEAHSSGSLVQLRREAVRVAFDPSSEDGADETVTFRIPAAIRKRGGTTIVDADGGSPKQPRVNAALVRAIVMARSWADQLARGAVKSTREIARQENLCRLYVGRLLPLAFLAPDLVEAMLDGRQPQGLSISALLSKPLPLSWTAQRERLRSLA